MNILITGGAGYIGSATVYLLLKKKINPIIVDKLIYKKNNIIPQKCIFYKSNISNIFLIKKIIKKYKINSVIHFAAYKNVEESIQNPKKYYNNNFLITKKFINCCKDNGIKNFIFSSSAAVYGHPKYLPLDEKHDLNPINYYGFTKLIIEQQLTWLNSLKGIKIGLLRYFNAAGYDINGRVKNKERNPQNLLPIVMEVASGERSNMSVYGNDYETPDGSCLRDYIHVNDLASGHVKAIDALLHKSKIITNLATGNTYSVLEVIELSKKITGKNINYSIVERRAGDPAALYAKSNNELNFKNKHSDLETIISSMWDIYKK